MAGRLVTTEVMTVISSIAPGMNGKRTAQHTLREAFVVNLDNGLHARPCALLVKALRPFRSTVDVEANGSKASGHSIMGLMALAASCGSTVTFTVSGEDAFQALAAVRHVFETDFEGAYSERPKSLCKP